MLNIYTTSDESSLLEVLRNVEGLSDAVTVLGHQLFDSASFHLSIENDQVQFPLPWHNLEAPVAFKPKSVNPQELIACILTKLGYLEEAMEFAKNNDLKNEILCTLQLLDGEQKVPVDFKQDDAYALHNQAVLTHYTPQFHNGVSSFELYKKAIDCAPDKELAAFSAKHMAIAHLDNGEYSKADSLLRLHLKSALPDEALYSLKRDLINTLFEQLSAPYDQVRLDETKALIWDCITYYEKQNSSLVSCLGFLPG